MDIIKKIKNQDSIKAPVLLAHNDIIGTTPINVICYLFAHNLVSIRYFDRIAQIATDSNPDWISIMDKMEYDPVCAVFIGLSDSAETYIANKFGIRNTYDIHFHKFVDKMHEMNYRCTPPRASPFYLTVAGIRHTHHQPRKWPLFSLAFYVEHTMPLNTEATVSGHSFMYHVVKRAILGEFDKKVVLDFDWKEYKLSNAQEFNELAELATKYNFGFFYLMNSEFKSEKSTKLKNQYKKKIKKLKKKLAKAEDIAADNEDTIAQLTEKLAALSIEARKKDQEIDNLRRLVIDLDAALLSSDQKKGKSRGEQMNPLETEMPHDLQADLITFD